MIDEVFSENDYEDLITAVGSILVTESFVHERKSETMKTHRLALESTIA